MNITFTKTSHDEHQIVCVRDDGTTTEKTLNSKSYLKHDFLHFLVETEAGLKNSFYGLVSSGVNLDDAGEKNEEGRMVFPSEEAHSTEIVAGVLQSLLRDEKSEKGYVEAIKMMHETQGLKTPDYVTEEFINTVKEKLRAVLMRWQGLKTGESVEFVF